MMIDWHAAPRGRVVGGAFGRPPRISRAPGTRPKSLCHRVFGSYLKLIRGRVGTVPEIASAMKFEEVVTHGRRVVAGRLARVF